jgi:tetratricopeptide (TPR) repeat protein
MVRLAAILCATLAYVAQDTPARAKETYERAIKLEREGNAAAALSLLWEAAGLAPRDPDIQYRLGESLERIGALDAAIDAYRQALRSRPQFREAANKLILTLVKAGKGPEARERAQAVVDGSPQDPDAHFTLGLAQSEQDVEGAITSFRRTLELAPRHALARYNLALVLKRADRPRDAIDELTRAIAIEPRAEAHYTLGVIYWQQGDLERAEAALRAGIAADERYADAHHTLGAVLAARRQWRPAIEALRRALELRPDLTSARYTLARVLRESGDEPGARGKFAEADRLRRRAQLEQEASVWTATGTQKLEDGDAAAAVDHFRRAMSIFEAYAPAHYQLGRALQKLGRVDAARAAFYRAQQLNPSLVPPPDPK